jgi:hypothetical protein
MPALPQLAPVHGGFVSIGWGGGHGLAVGEGDGEFGVGAESEDPAVVGAVVMATAVAPELEASSPTLCRSDFRTCT